MSLASEEIRRIHFWLKSRIEQQDGLHLERWQTDRPLVILDEIATEAKAREDIHARGDVDLTIGRRPGRVDDRADRVERP